MRTRLVLSAVPIVVAPGSSAACAEGMSWSAGVHLGPIGARLEWESLESGSIENLSMVSLSATLGF